MKRQCRGRGAILDKARRDLGGEGPAEGGEKKLVRLNWSKLPD